MPPRSVLAREASLALCKQGVGGEGSLHLGVSNAFAHCAISKGHRERKQKGFGSELSQKWLSQLFYLLWKMMTTSNTTRYFFNFFFFQGITVETSEKAGGS